MINEIYTRVANLLHGGLVTARHPFHICCLSTINPEGFPEARFLVLRAVNLKSKNFLFHTDLRSNKINSIKLNPNAEGVFYDKESKIQLRIPVKIEIHSQNEISLKQWSLLPKYSKLCYANHYAPGDVLQDPADNNINYSQISDKEGLLESGYINFCVLVCHFNRIEYLYLSAQGHIRALISWSDNDEMSLKYLAP